MSAQHTRSKPTAPGKMIIALPPKPQPRTEPSVPHYPTSVPATITPPIVPPDEPMQSPPEPPPEPLEKMQIYDPPSVFFPTIEVNPHQNQCLFCQSQLSGPRCMRCSKVNYSRMEFNRDRFLSSKWECAHCHFRNVHSNQKCIECNNSHYQTYR